jgi:hypothetical protein
MIGAGMDSARCKLCGSPLNGPRLDLGSLPACNRFLTAYASPQTHPLIMTACGSCGLVQLAVYPPPDFVMPRVPWIRYREPDAHLDDVVRRLLPSLSSGRARAIGVGPFDGPLLDRFEQHGVNPLPLDLLGTRTSGHTAGTYPNLETLQGLLRPAELAAIAAGCGNADIVVCRYVLEHSHDPVATLIGLKHLIGPGGTLLIEVPDSENFLSRSDYSFVWEEHICYFSESTLERLAVCAGYEVSRLFRYEGALEDALVAVLEVPAGAPRRRRVDHDGREAARLFAAYQANFAKARDAWQSRLAHLVSGGRKIGLLGVGHQAIMFVNGLGLQSYVSVVADDQPNKQGSFAPGIASAIVPSAAMASDPEIGTLLLAVSPRAEGEIKKKFATLLARGVRMYSIFAGGWNDTMAEGA